VRYFILSKKGNKPGYEHDKIRVINLSNFAPNELPDTINISLYKARLPKFLRTGYNVEICEETLENKGVIFRKIIIRSFDSAGVLLKQSLNLYIHHKQVYENQD
jgi:hypothetical protein